MAVQIVVTGEHRPQVWLQAVVIGLLRRAGDAGKRCYARVVAVEHHGARRRGGDRAQQARGVVDFAETVELVPQHVEQHAVARRHLFDEQRGVGLVQLEDGDVGAQPAAGIHLAHERGDHAAHEVRPGRVRRHGEAEVLQRLGDHARRRRLAVGPADDHRSQRQLGQRAAEEPAVDLLDDHSRERAAAADHAGCAAHGLADAGRDR